MQLNIDISDVNCSTAPRSNDWVKLGLSSDEAAKVSPLMCPKAVHRVMTGEEIQAVMRDCVEGRVAEVDGDAPEDEISSSKKKEILKHIASLANSNLHCIRASKPLTGVQFVISGPKFTPYIATWFSDSSFAAAFREESSGKTVVVFSSSGHQQLILNLVRTRGAQFPFLVTCALCGSAVRLKKCARCLAVEYCGKECQMQHWAEHKRVCNGGEK